MTKTLITLVVTAATATVAARAESAGAAAAAATADTVTTRISGGDPGLPPKYAVPDFIAPGGDAKMQAVAKQIGEVLWDDLNFEREFYLISRDTYKTIPAAASLDQVPLARWKELGTEGLVVGSVRRGGRQPRRPGPAARGQQRRRRVLARVQGRGDNPRFFAHSIADDIHKQQVKLRGVARTKLAFTSTATPSAWAGRQRARHAEHLHRRLRRREPARISVAKTLELGPTWSPDAQSIAYTSYMLGLSPTSSSRTSTRRGTRAGQGQRPDPQFPRRLVARRQKLAFMSPRDGNSEIYVVNRDGSGLRRLTNHPDERRDADLGAERQPDRVHVRTGPASRRSGS